MRAVVCEELGPPETLVVRDDWPEPEARPGEVKVQLLARAVQYVDVLMVAGQYQTKPPVPFIPGGEAAGEVVALGDGVSGFAVGDLVMSRHSPCGAFAAFGVSPADQTMKIPHGMSVDAAAGFRSAYSTAYHALVQRGRLQPGESLLVHGAAGGIGLAAVQVGKALGATVIGAASSAEKRTVVLANGADHVIDYEPIADGRGSFREKVKELTGGRGADVV
ncbi:MAG: zinc-binding dehydrogenase, partial [Alphaproteobacteria bacterium]